MEVEEFNLKHSNVFHGTLQEWINMFTSIRLLVKEWHTKVHFLLHTWNSQTTKNKCRDPKELENSRYSGQLKSEGIRNQSLPLIMSFSYLGEESLDHRYQGGDTKIFLTLLLR